MPSPVSPPASRPTAWSDRCSPPFLGIQVDRQSLNLDARRSFGALHDPGLRDHADAAGSVRGVLPTPDRAAARAPRRAGGGISNRRMPLPFIIQESTADLADPDRIAARQRPSPARHERDRRFHSQRHLSPRPGRAQTARAVQRRSGRLFARAPRSLHHLAAVRPRFILLTNYQRRGPLRRLRAPGDRRRRQLFHFRRAGGRHHPEFAARDAASSGPPPRHLPQMPAYHLTRPDRTGITMVNIGIGPSNARTITDHLACCGRIAG